MARSSTLLFPQLLANPPTSRAWAGVRQVSGAPVFASVDVGCRRHGLFSGVAIPEALAVMVDRLRRGKLCFATAVRSP